MSSWISPVLADGIANELQLLTTKIEASPIGNEFSQLLNQLQTVANPTPSTSNPSPTGSTQSAGPSTGSASQTTPSIATPAGGGTDGTFVGVSVATPAGGGTDGTYVGSATPQPGQQLDMNGQPVTVDGQAVVMGYDGYYHPGDPNSSTYVMFNGTTPVIQGQNGVFYNSATRTPWLGYASQYTPGTTQYQVASMIDQAYDGQYAGGMSSFITNVSDYLSDPNVSASAQALVQNALDSASTNYTGQPNGANEALNQLNAAANAAVYQNNGWVNYNASDSPQVNPNDAFGQIAYYLNAIGYNGSA